MAAFDKTRNIFQAQMNVPIHLNGSQITLSTRNLPDIGEQAMDAVADIRVCGMPLLNGSANEGTVRLRPGKDAWFEIRATKAFRDLDTINREGKIYLAREHPVVGKELVRFGFWRLRRE